MAYRLAWFALAAASLGSVAVIVVEGGMEPAIVGLRVLKSLVVMGVAALLFWRRQRDPVAALLAMAFLCWIVASNEDFATRDLLPMILDRVRFLLFALALLLFPDGRWMPRSNKWVALASIAACALGILEVAGLAPTRLYWPMAIGCVLMAIGSLVRRFRSTPDEGQKQQLKWVALGLVAGVGLILAARGGHVVGGPAVPLEALFQIGIVLIAFGFLIPLLRYRLYDAEAAISRSAALAVLTVSLVATFAGAEAIIEWAGQQFLGMGIGNISAAMAAAVAAVLLNPLHSGISDWAEQRFQRDLVDMKSRVSELISDVPENWSARQLGEAVLPLIVGAIHAQGGAVRIDGKEVAILRDRNAGTLHDEHSQIEFPLRCYLGTARGALLLGPRIDGCSYGRDDLEAVGTILPALGRAMLASVERDAARRRAGAFRRRLRARLSGMSARLKALEARAEAAG